jgi:hypothetical protein
MGRKGNPILDTLFRTSANADELQSNFNKHGGEKVCGSWGNCLRRFNEYCTSKQQQPPPSTPANAAPSGSKTSKSTAKRSGVPVAKTKRKPTHMVAEEERRKLVYIGPPSWPLAYGRSSRSRGSPQSLREVCFGMLIRMGAEARE